MCLALFFIWISLGVVFALAPKWQSYEEFSRAQKNNEDGVYPLSALYQLSGTLEKCGIHVSVASTHDELIRQCLHIDKKSFGHFQADQTLWNKQMAGPWEVQQKGQENGRSGAFNAPYIHDRQVRSGVEVKLLSSQSMSSIHHIAYENGSTYVFKQAGADMRGRHDAGEMMVLGDEDVLKERWKQRVDQMVEDVKLSRHGGRYVKTTYDQIVASFEEATQRGETAVALLFIDYLLRQEKLSDIFDMSIGEKRPFKPAYHELFILSLYAKALVLHGFWDVGHGIAHALDKRVRQDVASVDAGGESVFVEGQPYDWEFYLEDEVIANYGCALNISGYLQENRWALFATEMRMGAGLSLMNEREKILTRLHACPQFHTGYFNNEITKEKGEAPLKRPKEEKTAGMIFDYYGGGSLLDHCRHVSDRYRDWLDRDDIDLYQLKEQVQEEGFLEGLRERELALVYHHLKNTGFHAERLAVEKVIQKKTFKTIKRLIHIVQILNQQGVTHYDMSLGDVLSDGEEWFLNDMGASFTTENIGSQRPMVVLIFLYIYELSLLFSDRFSPKEEYAGILQNTHISSVFKGLEENPLIAKDVLPHLNYMYGKRRLHADAMSPSELYIRRMLQIWSQDREDFSPEGEDVLDPPKGLEKIFKTLYLEVAESILRPDFELSHVEYWVKSTEWELNEGLPVWITRGNFEGLGEPLEIPHEDRGYRDEGARAKLLIFVDNIFTQAQMKGFLCLREEMRPGQCGVLEDDRQELKDYMDNNVSFFICKLRQVLANMHVLGRGEDRRVFSILEELKSVDIMTYSLSDCVKLIESVGFSLQGRISPGEQLARALDIPEETLSLEVNGKVRAILVPQNGHVHLLDSVVQLHQMAFSEIKRKGKDRKWKGILDGDWNAINGDNGRLTRKSFLFKGEWKAQHLVKSGMSEIYRLEPEGARNEGDGEKYVVKEMLQQQHQHHLGQGRDHQKTQLIAIAPLESDAFVHQMDYQKEKVRQKAWVLAEKFLNRPFQIAQDSKDMKSEYTKLKKEGDIVTALIFMAILWDHRKEKWSAPVKFDILSRYTEALAINGYADLSWDMGLKLHDIYLEEAEKGTQFFKGLTDISAADYFNLSRARSGYSTALLTRNLGVQPEYATASREIMVWSYGQKVNKMSSHGPVVSELEAVTQTVNNGFYASFQKGEEYTPRRASQEKRTVSVSRFYEKDLVHTILGKSTNPNIEYIKRYSEEQIDALSLWKLLRSWDRLRRYYHEEKKKRNLHPGEEEHMALWREKVLKRLLYFVKSFVRSMKLISSQGLVNKDSKIEDFFSQKDQDDMRLLMHDFGVATFSFNPNQMKWNMLVLFHFVAIMYHSLIFGEDGINPDWTYYPEESDKDWEGTIFSQDTAGVPLAREDCQNLFIPGRYQALICVESGEQVPFSETFTPVKQMAFLMHNLIKKPFCSKGRGGCDFKMGA